MNKTIMTTAAIVSLVFVIAVNLWVDHQKNQMIEQLIARVKSLQIANDSLYVQNYELRAWWTELMNYVNVDSVLTERGYK